MVSKLLSRIFGSRNERLLKRMYRTVDEINGYETKSSALSDAELRAKTDELRKRAAGGETLDDECNRCDAKHPHHHRQRS